MEEKKEELTKEMLEHDEKIIELKSIYDKEVARWVDPHDKVSREVTKEDLERVMEEAVIMLDLCHIRRGIYPAFYAIQHAQIESSDPLCFFVTAEGEIIINPEIQNHTKTMVERMEGCFTFPDQKPIKVDRWNKIVARYQKIAILKHSEVGISTQPVEYGLSEFVEEDLSGKKAEIFQHEYDHCMGIYVYKY